MPRVTVDLQCPVYDSFRVRQVAGMFDVALEAKLRERFETDVPELSEPWQIGLIVGPSGSGKSSLARQVFGDRVYAAGGWSRDRAVIDGFGDAPIKAITGLLTSVGFSSPPSWIKPYDVLSGGERFRCDLARALSAGLNSDLGTRNSELRTNIATSSGSSEFRVPSSEFPLVVFDEFTSVVDRNTARIGSAAVAKSIRRGHVGCRFVAVTCHYDVEEWLEPDWTIDMATRSLHRRRLRRPPIGLEIRRCTRHVWPLFARHHYLSGALSTGARCYVGVWNEAPVAFCAVLPVLGRRRHWRISRVVTLPDFQGVGIGMALAEAIGDLYLADGLRFGVTAAHPALLAHCRRSSRWKLRRVLKHGSRRSDRSPRYRGSAGRAVASFEYLGREAE